jgi:hypothetical protein
MNWKVLLSKQKFLNRNFFISAVIIIILCYLAVWSVTGEQPVKLFKKDRLTVTAKLVQASDSLWQIKGRVYQQENGDPADSARVWLVLTGEGGNDYSPPSQYTKKEGEFVFDSLTNIAVVPATQSSSQPVHGGSPASSPIQYKVKEIKVSAYSDKTGLRGDKIIMLGQTGTNPIAITPIQMSLLLALFVISIIIPFLPVDPRFKYNWSLILAFLFSIVLIGFIWFGIHILPEFNENDVFLVGIGSIFKGTYDPGIAKDWLFSLTSKPDSIVPGFGVPLWVVFLSVVGSSLYTLSILVSEIMNRPDFTKLKAPKDEAAVKVFRAKLENIVRHQFYMLFSPIGAIFVYQLLVMTKTAGEPVTVAVAALGSGLSLNILLEKAVNVTKSTIGKMKVE